MEKINLFAGGDRVHISVLGIDGVHRLDQAAKRILAETGVDIPHEEMRSLFVKAGAAPDAGSNRIRIPHELVDECLAAAGKSFTIYGRDRTRTASFGIGKRNYNSTAGQAYWLDRDGRRRFCTLDDVRQATMLGDVLPRLTIVGAMADPLEIDAAWRCVEVAATMLRLTTKPIMFWYHDRKSAAWVNELFLLLAGDCEQLARYPFAYPFLEPISPLRFPEKGIDVLFETCKIPLPVPIGPMAQVGLSAPATLAGTLAQETAEILAGVCVTQLIHAGTPVCFGGIPHAFDMRTTQLIFAGPEQALMAVAMAEMGKYYGLPVYLNVGLTDSKIVDAQAGLEIGSTLLMGALSGADIFGHLGIAGVDQAASLEMLLFQHEVIEYIERIMNEFEVNDDTIALELIQRLGPGGNFIAEEHTLRFFRQEVWTPSLLNRDYWETWESKGRKTILDQVRDRLAQLADTYEPHPLDRDQEREIDKIVEKARKDLSR
ncbi:MAG: hypothetical protein EHM72_09025 [Calditrichaeota bacterium]|nr:MAG: hypothetical protein EHM72_09025 [Calditrichota bacterium]